MYFETLNKVPEDLREKIKELYSSDPLTYVYLYYDLITPEESKDTALALNDDSMVLIYSGLGRNDILLYGNGVELIPNIDIHNIQTFNVKRLDLLEKKFPHMKAIKYIDMICDSPSTSDVAVRLDEKDIDQLVFIKKLSTGSGSIERVKKILKKPVFGVKVKEK